MKFTGEYFIPPEHTEGAPGSHELQLEHKHRYLSTLPLVKGKIVLDIACGEGYGSYMLADSAAHVYAVDINPEVVEHASKVYANKKNISFSTGSVDNIPLPDQSVEVIVSFETIEHINEEIQKKFMVEAKRVLKPGGLMIISTPDKKNYTDRYNHHNEFHVREMYKDEFVDLLKTSFNHVNIFGQGLEVSSLIINKDSYHKRASVALYKVDDKNFRFEAKYIIALCSDNQEQANAIFSSIIPESQQSYLQLWDRIIQLQNEVEELGAWGKRSASELELKNAEVTLKKDQMHLTNNDLAKKTEELNSLKQSLTDRITEINGLKKELDRRTNDLHKLYAERNQLALRLQDIYSSDGWKLLSVYYNIKGKFLKENSGTYKSLKKLKNWLKPHKQVVTEESNTYNMVSSVPADINLPLTFPAFNQPVVSIVIPAYNNWEFTRNCLISIYQHTNDVSYEIIVGDNVSTDETVNIEKYFKNIVYLRNKENLGYIRNINNAASFAKGQFILTLNNDTTVTPNWLSALVDVMNKDKTVGLVGSKLIYPDGTLQEAGGIIWNDGSGWNFGNRKNPDAPEYNYLKEADYISGASNLIRKELWQQLKGLDERYVPAYFDDSDLAFSIRDLGYKVIYQPLSVVIHYEGLTHGTNTNSGTKKYQDINAAKFVEKWRTVLNKEHFKNGSEVFIARDRSRNKKTIVVVDHYVPQFDKDAGSRITFELLRLFVKLNYNVKFIGDNFYRHEPYTTQLQQMGIEVLYGPWYRDHWQEWVSENREYIDFFYLNRPHISVKYIDKIKKLTNAKIVYFGHDLHYVREQRQYEIEKNPDLLRSIKQWKVVETDLFIKSDEILTLSSDEKAIIEQETGKNNVHVFPALYYSSFPKPVTNFGERQHLLFIGGFAHKPNVDAVLWFANEVFPAISKVLNDVKFLVAGSNPPQEIMSLNSDKINVLGYISDETLHELYQSVKLVVIPLRYGAGVKGKIIEAIYNGVPYVSTRFGIEGLKDIQQVATNHDSAADFAKAVLNLYNNEEELKTFSAKEIEYASQNFSEDIIKNIMNSVFHK